VDIEADRCRNRKINDRYRDKSIGDIDIDARYKDS
jgi:hypothetical protein